MDNSRRWIVSLLSSLALALAAFPAGSRPIEEGAPMPSRSFFLPEARAKAKAAPAARALGVVSAAAPVLFNRDEMLSLSPGDEVTLAVPGGGTHALVFQMAQSHGDGIESWVGYVKSRGNDNRVILTTGPSGSYGVIDTPEGSYRIVPGNGHDWLVDMTAEQLHIPIPEREPNDGFPIPPGAKGASAQGEPTFVEPVGGVNVASLSKATPAPVNIDLLAVVTTGLANNLGPSLMTRLNFLVTRANTSYADSEVGIILRLVGVQVINYSDATSNSEALNAISPASGSFDGATFGGIETFRTQVKADMVALLRNGSNFGGSGVAWVGSNSPNANFMYSVTTGCVAGCESVWIHELGHNMGNMHDRATVAWQAGGTSGYGAGANPAAYGYAFCKSGALACNPELVNGTAGACSTTQPECSTNDASNFSEIMAYFYNTTDTIYKFSNPALTCASPTGDGVPRPCGIAAPGVGTSVFTGSADNTSSMNISRTNLSAIKSGDANPPGILSFTAATYSGTEAGGTVVLTVARTNGSGGAVSATFTATSGTATAGSDFTTTTGTVSWANGDTANKTITINVANDGITEGIESFVVTLSSPVGATLGWPVAATGVIVAPWPPGGTAPAGFSSASTPTLPWAVVTDSVDATGGDNSSFKSGAFADNATGNSSTVFTGNFVQGTLSFAYRVSSYPGNGFFEFLVDGVVVYSDSGDVGGWESYSTSISAGAHTLEWRYRKTLTFACRFAIPQGGSTPPFPNCQDRAWIDTVNLPLAAPVAVTIIKAGTGSGTVTSTPAGIACGATCTANITAGTFLQLTPAPAAGSVFTGWSGGGGACAGTGPCFFTVNGATTLTATFDTPSVATPRLANISTRMQVLAGADVLIGGFIIQGTSSKTVVVRARGPSLTAAGVPGALQNPVLQLFSGQTVIASNDDWGAATNAATIQSSGFAPADSREAAIYTTLAPGAYTAIVTGANSTTGVGIIEVFEVDKPDVPLANIATRGRVLTGNDVMIGGFIIQGNTPQTVVVRARGPSLTAAGVPGALANPLLQLFSGATQIAVNDNWQTAVNAASIQASGFAPADPFESAILITLNPGAYTAIVTGSGGTTGVGIVEVFAQ